MEVFVSKKFPAREENLKSYNFLTMRQGMTETEVRINLAENLLDDIKKVYKSDRSGKTLAKQSEQILSRCWMLVVSY